ncbi:maleylpyruvate isomerase family mycothiol-dependent enzyme [Nocardioides sp. 503]|uniref:maleylpyruvate isomerase family mycothiol-dependent enzyme n=1 Tax=Nocardioides sp. 503 TaxID=2508326 RepID=UPI0010706542|nr:maleylpyruvate isomerase family mycothiol-dependent enzyme [Nocardioides sp. 503]
MTRPDALALARAERVDLLALLHDLDEGDWDRPTLCSEWTVRDVVTHVLSFEGVGWGAVLAHGLRRLLPGGGRGPLEGPLGPMDAVNEPPRPRHDPALLVATLAGHLTPTGLTAGFGGRIALTDGLIHQQDLRRPLGRPRTIPAERLRAALSFAMYAPPVGAFRRVRGLRLVATDLDWSHGRGALVTGPGEALLLAAAGRAVALPELEGEGLERLASRMPAA